MQRRFPPLLILFSSLCAFTLSGEIARSAETVQPLSVGDALPAVEIRTPKGQALAVRELTQGTPAVFVFYRGGWCPYCNAHLAELADIEPQLQGMGFRLFAISPDTPALVAEAEAQADHPYRLLSDSPMTAARAFGVAFHVKEAEFERLKGFGIDIEASSGEAHRLLPVPAVFLTNAEGVVTFRYFNPDYRERLSGKAVLEAAKKTAP